jgi:biotin carboxylase
MTKEPCLVVIEPSEWARVKFISTHTRVLPIKTIAIVLDGCPEGFFDGFPCEVIRTGDFSYDGLDRIVAPLAEKYRLIGLATPNGFFQEGSASLVGAVVAQLARKYGCRSNTPEAVYRATSKYLMRERLRQLNVPSAKFALISSIEECEVKGAEVGFPVITKPSVGGASAFVRLNNDAAELKNSYLHFTSNVKNSFYNIDFAYSYGGRTFDNTKQLLCEEYLPGKEYSVEVLCLEDEIIPLLTHEKFDITHTGTCVLEPIVFAPTISLSAEDARRIDDYVAVVCRALELKNCFCHFELRMTDRGPIVCEVNPRIGGHRIKDNIQAFFGLTFGEIFLAYAAGEDPARPVRRRLVGANHLVMSVIFAAGKGYLKSIDGLSEVAALPGVMDVKALVECGDYVNGENEEVSLVMVGYGASDEDDIRRKDAMIRGALRYELRPSLVG